MMRINKKYAHITSCYHRWVYVYCLVCLCYLRLSVRLFFWKMGRMVMMVAFWCHQKSSINDFNLRFLNSSSRRSSGSLLLKEHLYFSRHTRTFIALSFFFFTATTTSDLRGVSFQSPGMSKNNKPLLLLLLPMSFFLPLDESSRHG